jgi:hypothetical protein
MNFISAFFRKQAQKEKNGPADQKKLNAATAINVLNFLSYGLTYGARTLAEKYQPSSKAGEFVAVSGQILNALKHHHDNKFSSDAVVLTMHVNTQLKKIEMTQVGNNVMLTLEDNASVIRHTTLVQLYAFLRNDMIKNGDRYGKELQVIASSYPTPD